MPVIVVSCGLIENIFLTFYRQTVTMIVTMFQWFYTFEGTHAALLCSVIIVIFLRNEGRYQTRNVDNREKEKE